MTTAGLRAPLAPTAFGTAAVTTVVSSPRTGADDADLVRQRLAALAAGAASAVLDLAEAEPTAAFSRRDQLLPGYADAATAMTRHGFAPMLRPVGGHLAAYGPGALVIHLWAPHPDPRSGIRQRFALAGDALAGALRRVGVDARVGAVPGEYCDGEFSVNLAGRVKLAGTGQRIVRTGYLFSAVVMVGSSEPERAALVDGYAALGIAFDPATVGCVADAVPGVTLAEVRDEVRRVLADLLPGAT